jgi:hypothetical protein
MRTYIFVICLTITLIAPSLSYARWATRDDAPFETEFVNATQKINKDGTYEEVVELQRAVLKESGREEAAKHIMTYNGDCSKLTILEAKTIYQGKEYPVKKNMIEDKPLASDKQGFDESRQVFIGFPKTEIGAKIYLKYKLVVSKVSLQNAFSDVLDFGNNSYDAHANIKIQSALPLNIKVNDPGKVLKVQTDKEKNFNNVEITLTKPVYHAVVNEAAGTIDPQYLTWVSLSSLEKREDIANLLSKDYERVLSQPLPPVFLDIVKAAAAKKDQREQINTITSLLSEKIQYLGDWRSIAGRVIPRDLNTIATSQVGDCKDMAASTVAMLRQLGYKADVALVHRGVDLLHEVQTLPSTSEFDHAMVKVTGSDGKTSWIDPTNFVSMAGGIFPDIANRMALVLNIDKPTYEKIPNITYEQAQISIEQELRMKKDNVLEHKSRLTLKGESAIDFTGVTLQASTKTVEDEIYKTMSGSYLNDRNKKEIQLPDLSSRVVKDLNIKLSYDKEDATYNTNLGQAYRIKANWLDKFIETTDDQVSDVQLGYPVTLSKRILLKDIKVKNINSLDYKINTPWVQAMRQCKALGNDIEITETVNITKSYIPNKDLKTEQYLKLKADLEKYFKNVAVIFDKG